MLRGQRFTNDAGETIEVVGEQGGTWVVAGVEPFGPPRSITLAELTEVWHAPVAEGPTPVDEDPRRRLYEADLAAREAAAEDEPRTRRPRPPVSDLTPGVDYPPTPEQVLMAEHIVAQRAEERDK